MNRLVGRSARLAQGSTGSMSCYTDCDTNSGDPAPAHHPKKFWIMVGLVVAAGLGLIALWVWWLCGFPMCRREKAADRDQHRYMEMNDPEGQPAVGKHSDEESARLTEDEHKDVHVRGEETCLALDRKLHGSSQER